MTVTEMQAALKNQPGTSQVVIVVGSAPPDGVQPSVSDGDTLYIPSTGAVYPQRGQVRILANKQW